MTKVRTRVGVSVRIGDSEEFDDIPAGEVTENIPESSIPWLVEQGHVEVVNG